MFHLFAEARIHQFFDTRARSRPVRSKKKVSSQDGRQSERRRSPEYQSIPCLQTDTCLGVLAPPAQRNNDKAPLVVRQEVQMCNSRERWSYRDAAFRKLFQSRSRSEA